MLNRSSLQWLCSLCYKLPNRTKKQVPLVSLFKPSRNSRCSRNRTRINNQVMLQQCFQFLQGFAVKFLLRQLSLWLHFFFKKVSRNNVFYSTRNFLNMKSFNWAVTSTKSSIVKRLKLGLRRPIKWKET